MILDSRSALLLCLLLLAPLARATDQVVQNCSNDAELRADLAAMQASGGGSLTFGCGPGAVVIVLSATLPGITTATSLDGGGLVTLSGGNAYRHFVVSGGASLTLRRVTIANAISPTDGGAIQSFGTLVIEDSRFQGNQSTGQSGGAILALGPTTIRRSTFFDNRALNGGAIYPRFAAAVVTIEDSVFESNLTSTVSSPNGLGGAILAWDGAQVTVLRSRFVGNTGRLGGAYFNTSNSSLVLRGSTLAANIAQSMGGGLYNQGTADIDASLVHNNLAGYDGGAILNHFTLTAVNSTFDSNGQEKGLIGVRNYGSASFQNVTFYRNGTFNLSHSGTSTVIRNTVIDGGGSFACEGAVASGGFNLASDATCNLTQTGDRPNTAPSLGPLAANGGPTMTRMPLGGSALIDGGTVQNCPSEDQRGEARPVGLSCDIGAVEVGPRIFADGFEGA